MFSTHFKSFGLKWEDKLHFWRCSYISDAWRNTLFLDWLIFSIPCVWKIKVWKVWKIFSWFTPQFSFMFGKQCTHPKMRLKYVFFYWRENIGFAVILSVIKDDFLMVYFNTNKANSFFQHFEVTSSNIIEWTNHLDFVRTEVISLYVKRNIWNCDNLSKNKMVCINYIFSFLNC